MQCFWVTKSLKRCGRQVRWVLCPDHRRIVLWLIVSGLATLIWDVYGDKFRQLYLDRFAGEADLPQFRIATEHIQVPGRHESPLSLTNIHNRRIYRLEIENPRSSQLANLEMTIQFPEPILEIRTDQSVSSSRVEASENWDKQPLSLSGDIGTPLTVEPYSNEEKTGLWRLRLDTIAPKSKAIVEVLTTNGLEGGMYGGWALEEEKSRKAASEALWFIDGGFQYASASEVRQERMIVSLEFDREKRVFRPASAQVWAEHIKLVRIRHGKGVRIPGVWRTKGYLVAQGKDRTTYSAPFALDSTQDINVKFGLFGTPPEHPGFVLTLKKP